ncbi:MAG: phosphoribosylformylglycinamidine synthase I [Patescibacteria group bacterium]|nr:phosphoribosylformylglycinamidine synthase I [Patescibacteria group bacterium]
MKIKPKVLVLKTDGTNCDQETAFAFELAGGNTRIVHVNELRSKQEKFNNFQILAIPGGFSYGDDVISGKILATELTSYFAEELKKFTGKKDTLTIGICNGFQVLIRTGLLPFGKLGKMEATLTNNDSGHFECRWVNLKVEKNSRCIFLNGVYPEERRVSYQVAHGEGKFYAGNNVLNKIENENLVVFRYVDKEGKQTQRYPLNPNGAINAIAGICDSSGRILGLMPHPERFVFREQYPNWRRLNLAERRKKPQGLPIFENMINFVKQT